MPNSKCQFVFVALFLFVLPPKAKAIRCYVCTSESTTECLDPFDVQQYSLQNDCNAFDVCVKHKIHETYQAPEQLKRGCVPEEYCSYEGYAEYCETCTRDLCNSSTKIASSFTIFALILAYNCLFRPSYF